MVDVGGLWEAVWFAVIRLISVWPGAVLTVGGYQLAGGSGLRLAGQTRRLAGRIIRLVVPLDPASRQWLERLHPRHAAREETIDALRELLRRAAADELARRGAPAAPEREVADAALVTILARLDEFRGASRFATWACAFVISEVSRQVAVGWTAGGQRDGATGEDALSIAVGRLPPRQREVFEAVALEGVPIDVVALRLGSTRDAVYGTLFQARRSLAEEL